MSGRLNVEIEHLLPAVVVRPFGVLDASSAGQLRAILLRCLAEQPVGLVLSTADVAVTDEAGLAVLANVARQSEHWPGTRIAVVSAEPSIAAAVDRMGIGRYVRLCPDVASAVQAIGQWPGPPMMRQRVAPDRHAPGLARTAVQDFCLTHRVGGDGDAAQLIASELVTNAVVHAGTPIDLTLRLAPDVLHIAVRDGGDGRARLTSVVDESAESGRGLLLVDALATSWGTFIPDVGKVVWATVRVRPLSVMD
jgi:anti-anti-sigma factor